VAERRPTEDRGRRRHAHDDADPHLVGPEEVQVAGEMEIEREGEVLEEVGAEAEEKLPREERRAAAGAADGVRFRPGRRPYGLTS
jgi:hypothetical protein